MLNDSFERINTVNNILTYVEKEIPEEDKINKLNATQELIQWSRILIDTIDNNIIERKKQLSENNEETL